MIRDPAPLPVETTSAPKAKPSETTRREAARRRKYYRRLGEQLEELDRLAQGLRHTGDLLDRIDVKLLSELLLSAAWHIVEDDDAREPTRETIVSQLKCAIESVWPDFTAVVPRLWAGVPDDTDPLDIRREKAASVMRAFLRAEFWASRRDDLGDAPTARGKRSRKR